MNGAQQGTSVDWAALSPLLALAGGAVAVLMAGLFPGRGVRDRLVPGLALLTLAATAGLLVWQYDTATDLLEGALRMDGLTITLSFVFVVAGMATVVMTWRHLDPVESPGPELYTLLLSSIGGMIVLVAAQNLVTLFLGFEVLSIPLYVLCAIQLRHRGSLESGLKYLVVGSVGSATLVYGFALIYGASGTTDFAGIATALSGELSSDVLLLAGLALALVGFAFKASVAPFHQWTPDVYEGAPTPITAFMATATKAAALGVLLRFLDVALLPAAEAWALPVAVLAAVTIIVGNAGALGQSSLKRLLAWSGVAQAGYLLAGVVVGTSLGVQATVFYLAVYLLMNMAAFAVVAARERETNLGDSIDALAGLGTSRPWLAWPMTIAMLALAGFPLTAGFIGKFKLIEASVAAGYTWVGLMIVIGSMISLAYYLKVIAAMWMREAPAGAAAVAATGPRPALAGASTEAPTVSPTSHTRRGTSELTVLAVLFGAATLAAGVVPQPLLDFAAKAGNALPGLF
ncbi:MAG: NADH-quinone oxidoreductase subunit N [Actinomycetota bacterium]|nr:NADH-quinone oxidoreductase subunit N [Actinomycetota bacterium]